MAAEGTEKSSKSSGGPRRLPAASLDIPRTRNVIARVVWYVCVLFAVILAAAALLGALEANFSNGFVQFILETADKVDLGAFDLTDPVKSFDGDQIKGALPGLNVKTLLFNYGLAAIAWLVIGAVLNRVIRPGAI